MAVVINSGIGLMYVAAVSSSKHPHYAEFCYCTAVVRARHLCRLCAHSHKTLKLEAVHVCTVVVLGYTVSPYYTFTLLSAAAAARDLCTLQVVDGSFKVREHDQVR
jgi:hypothetical protein